MITTLKELLMRLTESGQEVWAQDVALVNYFLFSDEQVPENIDTELAENVEYLRDIAERNDIKTVEGLLDYFNRKHEQFHQFATELIQHTNN